MNYYLKILRQMENTRGENKSSILSHSAKEISDSFKSNLELFYLKKKI